MVQKPVSTLQGSEQEEETEKVEAGMVLELEQMIEWQVTIYASANLPKKELQVLA